MIYLFLDTRTGKFEEIISEKEFNHLQFLQNLMWDKSLQYTLDNYTFGGDGRYSIEYFKNQIEKWKKLST